MFSMRHRMHWMWESATTFRTSRNQRWSWSDCISRIRLRHLPTLKLGLILFNEIKSCILLPLSNGETEVNDQKEKLLLFWKKKKGWKISKRQHNKQLILNCFFSVQLAEPHQRGWQLVSQLMTVSVHWSASIIFPSFSFFYAHYQILRFDM